MKKFLLPALILLPAIATADYSARDAFLTAPDSAVGLIDKTQRLDMIDYMEAGMTERTVTNRRNGKSKLTQLTDSTFIIENGTAQIISATLLEGKKDTLIAVIETLMTPAPDSHLSIYNKEWKQLKKAWKEPADKEWGSHAAKFLLTEYTLSGDTLTLTDRTATWDPEGSPAIKALKYVWNRKSQKFTPLK